MKVFLLLLDAGGSVVTRDELFDSVWGGVFVGDDSLNRAIARVRKIAAETAPGLFEIETIPRTGYRLIREILGIGGPGWRTARASLDDFTPPAARLRGRHGSCWPDGRRHLVKPFAGSTPIL